MQYFVIKIAKMLLHFYFEYAIIGNSEKTVA